jgi:hypothetical protein
MPAEHFINTLVPRRIPGLFNFCTGVEQCLGDGDMVDLGLVYGRPNRLTQNRSAVHVRFFNRNFSFNQQLDDIQVSAGRSVVKAIQSGVVSRLLIKLAANCLRELRCVCVLLEPGHFATSQPPYVNKLSIHLLTGSLESAGVSSQCDYAVSSIEYFLR